MRNLYIIEVKKTEKSEWKDIEIEAESLEYALQLAKANNFDAQESIFKSKNLC